MVLTRPAMSDLDRIDLAHAADFTLGPLTVRPSTREVDRDGAIEVLEPRVMQVLVALARAGGAIVSRDDLIQVITGALPALIDHLP